MPQWNPPGTVVGPSSQRSCSECVQGFGAEKVTVALLDLLGHHAYVLTTRAESYRNRELRPKSTEAPA